MKRAETADYEGQDHSKRTCLGLPRSLCLPASVKNAMREGLKNDDEVLVFKLAQDFVLERIVVPLLEDLKRDHAKIVLRRYSSIELWGSTFALHRLPSLSFFKCLLGSPASCALAQLDHACPDFKSKMLNSLLPSDGAQAKFMSFVFWFAHTLLCQDSGFQFDYKEKAELCLVALKAKAVMEPVLFPECWGHRVEVTDEAAAKFYKESLGIQIVHVFDLDTQTKRTFALFGPLSFVKQACSHCATITFSTEFIKRYPVHAAVTPDFLTHGYYKKSVEVGDVLCVNLHSSECTMPTHRTLVVPEKM